MKEKYYLDTVAVMRHAKFLASHKDLCYTSAFTVFEILAGITEKEYGPRKAALRNLFASGIYIDPRMPIDVTLESFGQQPPENAIILSDLRAIADELIASADYSDFMERNKKLKQAGPDIDLIKFFDQKLSHQFKKVFDEKTSNIREARRVGGKTAKFTGMRDRGLAAIARFLFKTFTSSQSIQSSDELQKLYIGSIDRFVDLWLRYYEIHANLLREPSRNDWLDILHVTYLGSNTSNIFVTDDKKILGLLNDLAVGSAILSDEWKRKLEEKQSIEPRIGSTKDESASAPQPSRLDRRISWIKNHKVLSIGALALIALIWLADANDALVKLGVIKDDNTELQRQEFYNNNPPQFDLWYSAFYPDNRDPLLRETLLDDTTGITGSYRLINKGRAIITLERVDLPDVFQTRGYFTDRIVALPYALSPGDTIVISCKIPGEELPIIETENALKKDVSIACSYPVAEIRFIYKFHWSEGLFRKARVVIE